MVNDDFTQDRTSVGGLYLIAMTEMVIAEDLRGAILEREPGAVVIIEGSLAEAERALEQSGLEVQGAFLDATPAEYAGSGIERAMQAVGRKAVLLGEAAEAQGPSDRFLVLDRPFSTEDVHRAMAQRITA